MDINNLVRFVSPLLLATVVIVFGCDSPTANGADSENRLRVLFIGNSYTSQVRPSIVAMFKASDNSNVEFEFVAPGGKTLKQHFQNSKTVEKIRSGNWDYVVLQEQSQTPVVYRDKFVNGAIDLDLVIRKSGAKTIFYQTWGRRDGDKQNIDLFPSYESMQKELSKAYDSIVKRRSAIIAPVGDAWAEIRATDKALGSSLYAKDGSHPSSKGAFVAACVFYTVLTGDDPATVDYNGKLSKDDANKIRKAVLKTFRSKHRTKEHSQ